MEKQLIETLSTYQGVSVFVTTIWKSYRVCKNLLVLSEGKTGAYGSKENIFELHSQRRSVDRVQNFSRAQAVSSDWVEATDWAAPPRD